MADGAEGTREAVKGELTGGCLCGAVRYTLREGMRLNPYACHCTDCQSRTGSAFSEHMLFALADLELEGELAVGEYQQPSGAHSRIHSCAQCNSPIYAANSTREGMGGLRCGSLDDSADVIPAAHIWVRSKQSWLALPNDAPQMEKAPETTEEWVNFVGMA